MPRSRARASRRLRRRSANRDIRLFRDVGEPTQEGSPLKAKLRVRLSRKRVRPTSRLTGFASVDHLHIAKTDEARELLAADKVLTGRQLPGQSLFILGALLASLTLWKYFTRDLLQWWPWGEILAPLDQCGLRIDPGLDAVALAGWLALIAAAVLETRRPVWAKALAGSALALGLLSASLYGDRWLEAAILGNYDPGRVDDEVRCRAVPGELVAVAIDRRMFERSSILILFAILVIIVMRLRPPFVFESQERPWIRRKRYLRWTGSVLAAAIASAFLLLPEHYHSTLSRETGGLAQIPFAPIISILLVVSAVSIWPSSSTRHVGFTAQSIVLGLAFGQSASYAILYEQHRRAIVSGNVGSIRFKSDLTPAAMDHLSYAPVYYLSVLLVVLIFWCVSNLTQKLLRPTVT